MKTKKTDFEKSLSTLQRILWRSYKAMIKHSGNDIESMPQEDREKVEAAFLNECLERRVH